MTFFFLHHLSVVALLFSIYSVFAPEGLHRFSPFGFLCSPFPTKNLPKLPLEREGVGEINLPSISVFVTYRSRTQRRRKWWKDIWVIKHLIRASASNPHRKLTFGVVTSVKRVVMRRQLLNTGLFGLYLCSGGWRGVRVWVRPLKLWRSDHLQTSAEESLPRRHARCCALGSAGGFCRADRVCRGFSPANNKIK